MKNLIELSIVEVADKIKTGNITPIQLVEAYIERIEKVDEQIIAWKILDKESALKEAEKLTMEAKNGDIRSVLHGIPVGIKDIIDVAGLQTRNGCKVFENVAPAVRDAQIVARLRELGAIILGKTETAELAYFDPAPTRNPYNLSHTPGGSSSGSAAAVAANMVPFSVGTQTNASVCRPAAYNGIGGYRPTINKLSLEGVSSFSKTFDSLGFFGKNFRDAAVGYLLMDDSVEKQLDLTYSSTKSLRIGIVTDPIYDEGTVAVQTVMKSVIEQLSESNHKLEKVIPPFSFSEMIEVQNKVMAYEMAKEHKELVEEHHEIIGERFCELVRSGNQMTTLDYESGLKSIDKYRGQMDELFTGYDLLIAPPTDMAAPGSLETTGNPRFTTPWTLLGVPLAVIPAGIDELGLPLAVMFTSAPGTDRELIQNCIHLETQIKPIGGPNL